MKTFLWTPVVALSTLFLFSSCSPKDDKPSGNLSGYDALVAHLEPGHEFLMTTSFEGEIDEIVGWVSPLIETTWAQYGQEYEESADAPSKLNIREAIRALGLSDIAGVGYSSRKLQNGLFHNRTFVHLSGERKGLFLLGGENRPFTLAERAPGNTWLMYEANIDLTHLLSVLNTVLPHLGEEATEALTPMLESPVGPIPGMPTWKTLLEKSHFSIELIVSADKDQVMTHTPEGMEIPALEVYLQIHGPVALFQQQVAMLAVQAEQSGQTVVASETGVRIVSQEPVPLGDGDWQVRPVVEIDYANEVIRLYSSPTYEEQIKGSSNRLRNQVDFQAALNGLPTEGTGRFYLNKDVMILFKNWITSLLDEQIENQDEEDALVVKELKQTLEKVLPAAHGIAGVGRNEANGILYAENQYFSHRSKLLSAVMLDIISTSTLLPTLMEYNNYSHHGLDSDYSVNVAITNNLRTIGMSVVMYQAEHEGDVSLAKLIEEEWLELEPVEDEIYPDFVFPAHGPWQYTLQYEGTAFTLKQDGSVTSHPVYP